MNKRLNPRSASPLMCDFLVHYTGSAPFSIKPDMRLVSLQHVEEGNYRHWQLLLDEEAHLVYHILESKWDSSSDFQYCHRCTQLHRIRLLRNLVPFPLELLLFLSHFYPLGKRSYKLEWESSLKSKAARFRSVPIELMQSP